MLKVISRAILIFILLLISFSFGKELIIESNYPLPHNNLKDIYIGRGVTNTSPQKITYHGTGGNGTDIIGGELTIAGGKGTGAGIGGSVSIFTSATGIAGTGLNASHLILGVFGRKLQ